MFKLPADNRGMTLLEILVAMGIFALLTTAVVSLFSYSWQTNKIVWEQLSTQSEGRKVAQDFINELRGATYSNIGAYPVEQADEDEIVFYSNIDEDSYRERIRYVLNGDTLQKGVTKPTGTPLSYDTSTEVITDIVHDVYNTTTPIFYYYGQNYGYTSTSPLSQPVNTTDIRMVGITLELEEDPRASPVPFYVEAKTEIRNLKDN